MKAAIYSDDALTPSVRLAVGLLIVSAAIITRLHDPQVGERASIAD